MAAVACNREARIVGSNRGGSSGGNNGGNNNGQTQDPGGMPSTYNLRHDWTVEYLGRGDEPGTGRVERIQIYVPGAKWFVIRTITPADFNKYYSSKAADFIEDEISGLREFAANARENVTNYCEVPDNEPVNYTFPWMFSGRMMTFVIGITDQGWPSGDYAFDDYEIEPDPADEFYPKWLGDWTITNGEVGYKITITPAESNLAYYVDGWETGSSISESTGTVMDEENLFTYYNSVTHNMEFISLFIQTYDDDNLGTVDEYFVGRIKDSNNDWWDLLSEEQLLAVAKLSGDYNSASVEAANVETSLDGTIYKGPFTKMQYVCVDAPGNIYTYNDNVPSLPLSMIRTSSQQVPNSVGAVRRLRGEKAQVVRNHPVGSSSLEVRSTPRCSPSGRR